MPIELPASIDRKPLIRLEDGTEIIDLAMPSQKLVAAQPMTSIYIVDDETAMRVDAIAAITLGSITHVEKILKFNDISNPFSIDAGYILFIPDLIYADINLNTAGGRAREKLDIRNQYIDPEKGSKLDPMLAEYSTRQKAKKADPSKSTPPLPPNFANPGDKEIEIKGGKIYFGLGVSKTKEDTAPPQSKSEFLAKLVSNRKK